MNKGDLITALSDANDSDLVAFMYKGEIIEVTHINTDTNPVLLFTEEPTS